KNQAQMRDYFRTAFGGAFGGMVSDTFEQMGKQNMAIFEQAMRMFSPFAAANGGAEATAASPSPAPAASAPSRSERREAEAPSSRAAEAASPVNPPAFTHLRPVQTPPQPQQAQAAAAPAASLGQPQEDGSIRQMQSRLDELQKQIAALSKGDER
ncbi:MAG TPA: hypothetical protein VHB73_08345, partial [Alphaproteobacteria bacterium]|nr:hypothetical protein [Alphaproteobacteria bacterium]